jgi:subtilase family serine protease
MSKFKASKKLLLLLCSIAISLLGMQAEAKPARLNLPAIPASSIPHTHYIIVSKHGTATPGGFAPIQLTTAYGLPLANQGEGETIALVEAGDDPNIESDLGVFSTQFNLPACTTANGCFKKVFADDTPAPDAGWAVETSLDVEWAHAMAPKANILLVEGFDAGDLYFAVQATIAMNPSVISLSWGGGEFNTETSYDQIFQASTVPIVACTGDDGNGAWYPAVSPYVTAVGGTQLTTSSSGSYVSEVGWSGSGGGVSLYEPEPSFQKNYVIPQDNGFRGVPDVSFNAADNTPFAVYDSFGEGGWIMVAGTSGATPSWAGIIAVMKSAKHGNFRNFNQSIYSVARETNPVLLHDVMTGDNGTCGYLCDARSGYDYVTGLGTPIATALVNRFM